MQKITADLSELPRQFGPDIVAGRVETGPLVINDDWPGVFIRGDNAAWYAMQLNILMSNLPDTIDVFTRSSINGLISTLESCLVKSNINQDTDNFDDSVGC